METPPEGRREEARPLDDFLVGPENALAFEGAMALARGESTGLSPLVIHGPSGVGKSRLLAGLVAERLARRPDTIAAHLEAETFAALCAEAAGRPGGWAELRARFRRLDLFVLEDLHALDRAPLALAELAHTLDALDEAGASVAVSARAGPGRWDGDGWPSRLVNRLVGGLSVRVDPPGPDLRRRYALDRARARGLTLAAEALDALAESADGFRTLDGWLARVALASAVDPLGGRPLGRPRVESILSDDPGQPDATATLDRIARAVADRFGVRLRDLRSSSRRQALVVPRHLAIHLARLHTGLSFASLGAYFGGRDAATIRHACRAASLRLASDPSLASAVSTLIPTIEPPRTAPGR